MYIGYILMAFSMKIEANIEKLQTEAKLQDM